MKMSNRIILWLLVVFLAASNLFWSWRYANLFLEETLPAVFESNRPAGQALEFLSLFTEKVLWAKGEVDFETRLQLENMIRALNDREALDLWRRFVQSKNELAAQEEAKNLVLLLLNRARH